MTLPQWTYDSECWVLWQGPVLMGRVSRLSGREWEAWALGGHTQVFPRLERAQWWVELWAKETV